MISQIGMNVSDIYIYSTNRTRVTLAFFPLQYSSLENSIEVGAWWATVCRIIHSQTKRSNFDWLLVLKTISCLQQTKKKKRTNFIQKLVLKTFNLADRISVSNPLLLLWLLIFISSRFVVAFSVILKHT